MNEMYNIVANLKDTASLLTFFLSEFQLDSTIVKTKEVSSEYNSEHSEQFQQDWIINFNFFVIRNSNTYSPVFAITYQNIPLKEPQLTADFFKTLELVSKIQMLKNDLKLCSFVYNLKSSSHKIFTKTFQITLPLIYYWHLNSYVLPWFKRYNMVQNAMVNYSHYLLQFLKMFYEMSDQETQNEQTQILKRTLKSLILSLIMFFNEKKVLNNQNFKNLLQSFNIYDELVELSKRFMKKYAKEIGIYQNYLNQEINFTTIQRFLEENQIVKQINFKVQNKKLICIVE